MSIRDKLIEITDNNTLAINRIVNTILENAEKEARSGNYSIRYYNDDYCDIREEYNLKRLLEDNEVWIRGEKFKEFIADIAKILSDDENGLSVKIASSYSYMQISWQM